MTGIFKRIEAAWHERAILLKAISFGLVGLVNSAIDFGVFSVGYYLLGLPIVVANLMAWVVAVSASYVMNSQITFAHESGRTLSVRRYFGFALSQAAGFFANTATVYAVSYVLERMASVGEGKAVLIGKLLAIGASFAVNFSLSHFVVFRRIPGGQS
ncbi:MAG: GtrA family protein [Pseudolabrys sp.]|nr:GtrA family protein [Pseudolabrys sp.]